MSLGGAAFAMWVLAAAAPTALADASEPAVETSSESLPACVKITSLSVDPPVLQLSGPTQYTQLLISGVTAEGETYDLTRMVALDGDPELVELSEYGIVRPLLDGVEALKFSFADRSVGVAVVVTGTREEYVVDYIRDVAPAISKLGCNAGTCHGSKEGKNGFKLSLRGYDALYDTRAFTDDLSARRINRASPEQSLMLLKATGSVPHVGGRVVTEDHPYYEVLRDWIAGGALLNVGSSRVTGIELFPKNPVVAREGLRQQLRVIATYSDGARKDVTAEAFVESGNTDVAECDDRGLVTVLRRGEAAMLARFEGAYAATTLTVMGDRTGFEWQAPETHNYIDSLVAAKWQRMKIRPSELCTDAEFLRRVHLDLTGLPPTVEQTRAFLDDERPSRQKRNEVIDELVGNDDFVDHWTNKWADLLQVNRKFLGADGAKAFRSWIRERVAANMPYDAFAHEILTASGSNRENPGASYFKILRTPEDTMENTTHLFLGVRFNCNKCHDHPFERWTQDQYYETAAFFAQFGLKKDPDGGNAMIGQTAVEAGKPLYEIVFDKTDGDVKHERTGEYVEPAFPFAAEYSAQDDASRRERLAAWMTSADNQYFARSYVNRLWGYLMGVGLIEPIDDIRAGNPPTNPELLDRLTDHFVSSGFDTQELMRKICKSRTYQLSVATNEWNEDDLTNFSHAMARRLPAEVLYDAVHRVVASTTKLPGVPAGTRAAQLPDVGVKLPGGFLDQLGRPARESACECERTSSLQLGPVMALVSGPTLHEAIHDGENGLSNLVTKIDDDRELFNEVFLRILSRPATQQEIAASLELVPQVQEEFENVTGRLEVLEAKYADSLERLAKQRETKIAAAEAAVQAREEEIAAEVAEQARQRQERINKAQEALASYDETVPEKLASWTSALSADADWLSLDPSGLLATNGAELTESPDRSIYASGNQGRGTYQIVAPTDLQGITGIRIEALRDERLESKGPGRNADGNFVLTEFRVTAAPRNNPVAIKNVSLRNPHADFSQKNYSVATAIDGKQDNNNNGWAVAPELGKSHRATFETAEKIGFPEGTLLTFHLDHLFSQPSFGLSRFRISVTTHTWPVDRERIPAEIRDIAALPLDQRSDEQRQKLLDRYRADDAQYQALAAQLAEAEKPLPDDPELVKLREALTQAEQPIPIPRDLAELRQEARQSAEQAEHSRLTAVQDLAWALINSPAFLFNR